MMKKEEQMKTKLEILITNDCRIKIVDSFALNYDITKYYIEKYFNDMFINFKKTSKNYMKKSSFQNVKIKSIVNFQAL